MYGTYLYLYYICDTLLHIYTCQSKGKKEEIKQYTLFGVISCASMLHCPVLVLFHVIEKKVCTVCSLHLNQHFVCYVNWNKVTLLLNLEVGFPVASLL